MIFQKKNKSNKLLFKLIVYQITIKKEKIKLFNSSETALILSYVKEYIESKFQNIIIDEAFFYYIIESNNKDNNIIKNCKENGFGCILLDIQKNNFIKKSDCIFKVQNFSKFSSCFLFKSEIKINNKVDSQIPIIIEELKQETLENIFEPLFKTDINIPKDYYVNENLKVSLDIIKDLTNYSFIILTDLNNYKNIKFNCLTNTKYYNYETKEIVKVKNIVNIESKYNIKLIAVLVPIKVKKFNLKNKRL